MVVTMYKTHAFYETHSLIGTVAVITEKCLFSVSMATTVNLRIGAKHIKTGKKELSQRCILYPVAKDADPKKCDQNAAQSTFYYFYYHLLYTSVSMFGISHLS